MFRLTQRPTNTSVMIVNKSFELVQQRCIIKAWHNHSLPQFGQARKHETK